MPCECREPSLNEMMRDPIIRAVMARDEVAEHEVRRLLDEMRRIVHGEERDGRRPDPGR
jgi:hypothetical protein